MSDREAMTDREALPHRSYREWRRDLPYEVVRDWHVRFGLVVGVVGGGGLYSWRGWWSVGVFAGLAALYTVAALYWAVARKELDRG